MVEITENEPENAGAGAALMGVFQRVLERLGAEGESLTSALAAIKVLFIRCLGAAIAYATQVVLAQQLGQSEYGVFALVWVWIIILGHLTPLGMSQILRRYVPHFFARNEQDLLRGFLSVSIRLMVAFSCTSVAIAALILWSTHSFFDEIYLWPFVLALMVFPLVAMADYVENLARAFNWHNLAVAPRYIFRHGLIAIGMIALGVLGAPATAWLAMCVTFVATLITLITQSILVYRRVRAQIPSGAKISRTREWMNTALPFVFVDGTAILFSNADILILSLFVEPSSIAIYFAASRILQLVAFVPYAATAATAQRFSALNAIDDQEGLRKLAKNTARYTFLGALAASGFIYLVAPFLLKMFGAGFVDAEPILLALMIGLLVQTLAGPGEDLLSMLGHGRACAISSLAALALNIALNLALIPVYGVLGAAVATAISLGVRSFSLTWLVKTRLNMDIIFTLPMPTFLKSGGKSAKQ